MQPVYSEVASKGLTSTKNTGFLTPNSKRVRDASIYASKKISLKFLFLSDIFLFPPIRQQVPILA